MKVSQTLNGRCVGSRGVLEAHMIIISKKQSFSFNQKSRNIKKMVVIMCNFAKASWIVSSFSVAVAERKKIIKYLFGWSLAAQVTEGKTVTGLLWRWKRKARGQTMKWRGRRQRKEEPGGRGKEDRGCENGSRNEHKIWC